MSNQEPDADAVVKIPAGNEATDLILEYELDAPPEKVWRAITIREFREQWLPGKDLVEAEPLAEVGGEEVSYRMKDSTPPYLESVVAFQLRPDGNGRSVLKIIHRLADTQIPMETKAANNNEPIMMCAA
ncbi:polyketide cyclase [Roseibium porphyridii]|uniref:Polyketide cyclase n=1 Tax=Roseibium porphyridii TaxID=2866279 RepID=A0ABY8F154_9HYPH|nr:polyketide cyclase [Roseibium sp. KMA01]WFE89170.1 polyketide cyclase [Roseibium sp. KMA01]